MKTLVAFDKFNELEANCSLSTRRSYLETLCDLGLNVPKPFEQMGKEDLQEYVASESKHHTETTIEVKKQRMKRFFNWLGWVRVNKGNGDEEKHLTISCSFLADVESHRKSPFLFLPHQRRRWRLEPQKETSSNGNLRLSTKQTPKQPRQ